MLALITYIEQDFALMNEKHVKILARLETLGAKRLAEALHILSERSETVAAYVEMLISPPSENVSRIQNAMDSLACEDHFYGYDESMELTEELESILEDILINITDADTGTALMVAFFYTDESVLERCDDSDGDVCNVYEYQATDIFVQFASSCKDKAGIAQKVTQLFLDSEYGTRSQLLKRAGEYLPNTQLRQMVANFEAQVEKCKVNDFEQHHALMGIEILASQLNDPELFEKARLRAWPEPSPASCLDIAEVYHQSERDEEALLWLERITEAPKWQEDKKDQLLYTIFKNKKDNAQAEQTAWRIFHRGHNKERFELLVAVVGEQHRNRLLNEQTTAILESDTYQQEDASFLVAMEKAPEAAAYLVRWASSLNGDDYYDFKPIADHLEAEGHCLAATVVYRALLNSILQRAISKAYHHGANYLHKLDALAENVEDWQAVLPHQAYREMLLKKHKRKWRFWQTCGERP